MLTAARLLAVWPKAVLGTLQLTGLPGPPAGAHAVPSDAVAWPSILAQAALAAACPVHASRACLFATGAHPASCALALPIGWVTAGVVVASACLVASKAMGPRLARGSTPGVSPASGTEARSRDMVAEAAVQAVTLLLTLKAVEAIGAGFFTVGPGPPWQTRTSTAHMLASGTILTLAPAMASGAKRARWALLITVRPCVACLAVALACDRVAAPIAPPAVAHVGTVGPPASRLTRFAAVMPGPALRTGTAAGDVVATALLT